MLGKFVRKERTQIEANVRRGQILVLVQLRYRPLEEEGVQEDMKWGL